MYHSHYYYCCCWSRKAFQIFPKFFFCLFCIFCLSSSLFSSFVKLACVYCVVMLLLVLVFFSVFFDLLQTDFKMLNSQSANITFHLKQNRVNTLIHSFNCIQMCVCIRVCVCSDKCYADDVFSHFFWNFYSVNNVFLYFYIHYWAHTTVAHGTQNTISYRYI